MSSPVPSPARGSTSDSHTLPADVSTWPPADVGETLASLDTAEARDLFAGLPRERRAAVFRHVPCEMQQSLLDALEEPAARQLLEDLETDDRTRFLEQLPDEQRAAALHLLGPDARHDASRQLQYPPDSVGRLMSLTFAAVPAAARVEGALAQVRGRGLPPDAVHTIYVTDERGRLIDALDLARFVLSDPESAVRDIMDGIYVAIRPDEDREQAVRLMQKHDILSLPVVNAAGVLVGVVAVDDVMEVAEEEATEDIHRQAGIEPLRATYPDVAARSLFQKRLPWLAALIFVYLGASGVISAFEEALAAELVLAAFIPLLMGSGGNVGAQSGTLIVRALAVGDLEGRRWVAAFWKELGVGVVLGAALGVLAGGVAYVRGGTDIAIVVGCSMALIVVAANLTGTLLPVLLARAGVDPAVAGSPVITSVTDVSSLLIYLGLATWVLAI